MKNINFLFYTTVIFFFLLISNQIKAAECSLNDVSFFDLNLEQISAIEKSGGNCTTSNEYIDLTIESCKTDILDDETFFARATNYTSYNFDGFQFRFTVYDINGYEIDSRWLFGLGGMRPGKEKNDELLIFDSEGCSDISSAVISEGFFRVIRNGEAEKLEGDEYSRVMSMIQLNWLDDNIQIRFDK